MKTITQHGAMIFSRLERARLEHEIAHAVMMTWVWHCATVLAVLLAAAMLWRIFA